MFIAAVIKAYWKPNDTEFIATKVSIFGSLEDWLRWIAKSIYGLKHVLSSKRTKLKSRIE